MDCCNYMQYRHPYYGPQFYENGLYNRDYYGHPYQSYYANSHYYSQQWPYASSFPDYVYNPKEARIRKAMREASRERIVGAAPIPSPRSGRKPQTWTSSPEEQLMMTPSSEMGGPICNSPMFTGHGQFMQPINGYTKLLHVMPSTGWLPDTPTYLQQNPMADLQQHQANMWQQYQEPLRSCAAPTYMLDAQINLYQEMHQNDAILQKRCKPDINTFTSNSCGSIDTIQTTRNENENKSVKNEKIEENKDSVEAQSLIKESPTIEESEIYLPVFQETVVVQNPFDKDDDMKLKKVSQEGLKTSNLHGKKRPADELNTQDSFPGVCFAPSDGIDRIYHQSCRNKNVSYLRKYSGHVSCSHNHSHDEHTFDAGHCNYFAYPFAAPCFQSSDLSRFLLDNCCANLIYTDVGIIPMYYNNADVEKLLNKISNMPAVRLSNHENQGSDEKLN